MREGLVEPGMQQVLDRHQPLPVPESRAPVPVTSTRGFGLEMLFDIIWLNSSTLQTGKLRLRQRW